MINLLKSLIKYKKFEVSEVNEVERKTKNLLIANINHKLYKIEHITGDYYQTEKDKDYNKYYFKFINGFSLNANSYKATLLKLSKRDQLKLLLNKETWTMQQIIKF